MPKSDTWFQKGRSGNPGGRKKGHKAPLTRLLETIEKLERRGRFDLMGHYVERALKNDAMLRHLIDRLIPAKQELDLRAHTSDEQLRLIEEQRMKLHMELEAAEHGPKRRRMSWSGRAGISDGGNGNGRNGGNGKG
jgi:hypothetical protein